MSMMTRLLGVINGPVKGVGLIQARSKKYFCFKANVKRGAEKDPEGTDSAKGSQPVVGNESAKEKDCQDGGLDASKPSDPLVPNVAVFRELHPSFTDPALVGYAEGANRNLKDETETILDIFEGLFCALRRGRKRCDTIADLAYGGVVRAFLSGFGQVIFLKSPFCGFLVLVALLVAHWERGLMAAWGCLVSSLFGWLTHRDLTQPSEGLKNGLFGYSGVLVGCLVAGVGASESLKWKFLLVSGLAASTSFLMKVFDCLGNKLQANTWVSFKMQQWVWAFHVVSLPLLLSSALPRKGGNGDEPFDPLRDVLKGVINGFPQIFCQGPANEIGADELGGGIILVAMLFYSPAMGGVALLGSLIGVCAGMVTAFARESDKVYKGDVRTGAFSFNVLLAGLIMAVFLDWKRTRQTVLWTLGGMVLTGVVQGLLVCFSPWGTMGWPFLTVCTLLHVAANCCDRESVSEKPGPPEEDLWPDLDASD